MLEALRKMLRDEEYWMEESTDGVITLSCSPSAWEPPRDSDPAAGDICTVSVEDGEVHWRWQWEGHGYDEWVVFPRPDLFLDFYKDLLRHGISGVDYADYVCERVGN